MGVLSQYAPALGWGIVGAVTMAISLVLLLRIFTWLTPIDEWVELSKSPNTKVVILGDKSGLPIILSEPSGGGAPPARR